MVAHDFVYTIEQINTDWTWVKLCKKDEDCTVYKINKPIKEVVYHLENKGNNEFTGWVINNAIKN